MQSSCYRKQLKKKKTPVGVFTDKPKALRGQNTVLHLLTSCRFNTLWEPRGPCWAPVSGPVYSRDWQTEGSSQQRNPTQLWEARDSKSGGREAEVLIQEVISFLTSSLLSYFLIHFY